MPQKKKEQINNDLACVVCAWDHDCVTQSASRRQQVAVGPADRQRRQKFSGENRRNQPLQFMAAGFVLYPAVSGSRQRRLIIRKESCGFEEFGNSNLWFSNSCQNPRQQVEPGTARSVGPADRQRRPSIHGEFRGFGEFGNSNLWFPNSSPEPAVASGSRHCRPAASGCRLSLPEGIRGTRPPDRRCRCRSAVCPASGGSAAR